jgi:peroxiredoxin Q/BCP
MLDSGNVSSEGLAQTTAKREERVMNRHIGLRAALLGLGSSLVLIAAALGDEPKVGEPAPPFSLQGSDGKSYSLAQFKGKSPVVLAWFPKAFTAG